MKLSRTDVFAMWYYFTDWRFCNIMPSYGRTFCNIILFYVLTVLQY